MSPMMRTWFHKHRMRQRRSNSASSAQPTGVIEGGTPTNHPQHLPTRATSEAPTTTPAMASRLSIERYLSAPLSDEAAGAPAINAAIQKRLPQGRIDVPHLYQSRDTSIDVQSDGRPTFFTAASVPETIDTSYSTNSTSKLLRNVVPNDTVELSSLQWPRNHPSHPGLLNRPATSGTLSPIGLTREWAENVEKHLPRISLDDDNDPREKTDRELHEIQHKAQELELMMQQYIEERRRQHSITPRLSNETARAKIAANSKLARILGSESTDVKIPSRSRPALVTNQDSLNSPTSIMRDHDILLSKQPRKTKSNSALNEEAYTRTIRDSAIPKSIAERHPQQPRMRPTFYCTFCQKRFHSRVEWLKHERTIHMPEEIWICCPRTGEFPTRCPFCEKGHPSPAHLADHDYLSCQGKPLSERTFRRKDNFLQHISQVHRVSPEQKPARLTELETAWRQPLPPHIGHQALHCGFCGEIFTTYQERATHVSCHFVDGADMTFWWKDRACHEELLPDADKTLNAKLPHVCVYCQRTFKDRAAAESLHPTCTMWSCSFLPGLQYTMYPNEFRPRREVVCCYCNEPVPKTVDGKVNGALLEEHMAYHNFRTCDQTLYFSGQRFRQHLQDSHRSSHDSTLFAGWTLLLKSSRKDVPSIFEQGDKRSSRRRARTNSDSSRETIKSVRKDGQDSGGEKLAHVDAVPLNFMEFTDTPQRTEPNKLRRKQSTVTITRQSGENPRPSLHLFARAPAAEVANETAVVAAPSRVKPEKCIVTLTASGVPTCPSFYRKRLDASTRNRVYILSDDEVASESSHQMVRRIQGSVFGGLILHSSLVASVPSLMTNCVDVYPLQ